MLVTYLATLFIYDAVGIVRGKWTVDGCIDDDAFRIKNSCHQSGEYMKTRRRMLRGLRKSKTVETKKKEGKVYGAGVAS